jgi:hypothetical protein
MNNLETCKKCNKRKFDFQRGIFCGLTNEKPTFENTCPNFEGDETITQYKGLEVKPNNERSRILLLLIWIVLALEIISIFSNVLQYNLLQTVSNGEEVTNEAAKANDLRVQIIAIVFFITYIISAIAFIMWFRRAYYNLHQKVRALSFTEGWAAGCWFVPFVNLYRPYQIMKEMYEETKGYLKSESLDCDLSTRFLGAWWILWIANGTLGQVIFRLSRHAHTLPKVITLTTLSIISSVLGIGLALVTVRVIRDYAKVEGLLREDEYLYQ